MLMDDFDWLQSNFCEGLFIVSIIRVKKDLINYEVCSFYTRYYIAWGMLIDKNYVPNNLPKKTFLDFEASAAASFITVAKVP